MANIRHVNPKLVDGNAADHAGPVVVGAPKIICSGPVGRQKEVLRLAGLHHDLGMFAIENIRIIDIGVREEQRRRDFMRFLAMVLQVQPVMHVVLKDQMVRQELVVHHDEVERNRLRPGLRRGGADEETDEREQRGFGEISIHRCHPRVGNDTHALRGIDL